MPDEKEKVQTENYEPPRIIERKQLEVELFSDEPMPWGP